MIICPKCGKENREDARFCNNCGTPLDSEKRRERREEVCFGEDRRGTDYLGLISFGIFIIIVGSIIILNPNIFSNFLLWIDRLTNQQAWIRPPQGLIKSAVLFFGLIGASNFLMACIRLMVDKRGSQVLTNVLSGVALVLFAYLINLYHGYVLRLRIVVAIEMLICGLLIVSYIVVRYILTSDKQS